MNKELDLYLKFWYISNQHSKI